MILDFRDSWLEAFYVEDKPDRRIRPTLCAGFFENSR